MHTFDCSCSSSDWIFCRRAATSPASFLGLKGDLLLLCKALQKMRSENNGKQGSPVKVLFFWEDSNLMFAGQGLSAGSSICLRCGRFSSAKSSLRSASLPVQDPQGFAVFGISVKSCSRKRSWRKGVVLPLNATQSSKTSCLRWEYSYLTVN